VDAGGFAALPLHSGFVFHILRHILTSFTMGKADTFYPIVWREAAECDKMV
jgi:hypothetical protein